MKIKENSLANNAIFNVIYKSLTVVFPLITVSYASRVLGPKGIGEISSAQNVATYFIMFASLGIPQYGVRALARTKKDIKDCNHTFTELFIINLIASVLSSFIYMGLIMMPVFEHSRIMNVIFASTVVLNIFNIDWVYRAFEQYRYIAIRSFVIKMISLVLLLFFVRKPNDIFVYAIIVCFGTVGNYLLNMPKLKYFVHFSFDSLKLKHHMRPILLFFAAVIAVELYSLVDVTMLTWMTASKNVAYYANASKIVKTISATITAIGAVLMPRLSVYYNEKREKETQKLVSQILKTIVLLTVPCMIGVILTADKIIVIAFGTEFIPAITTLKMLSPLIIAMPLSGGIGAQVLQTSNNEKKYMYSVYIGTFANIILNLILIKHMDQNGAALASTITECIVTVMMLYFSGKIVSIYLDKRFIICILMSCLTMTICVIICDIFSPFHNHLIIFVSEVAIGIFSYFGSLLVQKNEMLLELLNKIKRAYK